MCTINIQVDESTLREVMPELDTTAAIRLWVQQLIDLRIQQMELENRKHTHEMNQEDLWRAIEQDPELTLKPSEIVDDDGETIDLETFRSDLHRMIEEVYAEP